MVDTSLTGLSLFGSTTSSSSTNLFTPITIGADLLSASYSAKLAANTIGSARATQTAATAKKKDNVTAPWEEGRRAKSVESAYLDAKALSKFIDLNSDSVKNANGNADYKELFALFNGLSSLRALAAYGAQNTVTSGVLTTVNSKFQQGLDELRKFLSSYDSNKLTLLFGKKSDQAESFAALGKDAESYSGRVAVVGSRDTPVAGLTGNEQFTVSITKSTTTQDFLIDLSNISGPLTLDNIVNYVNQVIHAPQAVDTDGNPVFTESGAPVPKFTSYFTVDAKADNLFALKLVPSIVEKVSLSAASANPSLYVTGTTTPLAGGVQSGFLTKLDGIDGSDPTNAFRTAITALAPGQAQILAANATKTSTTTGSKTSTTKSTDPVLAKTSTAATATDSQGNVYVLGATAGDLGNEINRTNAQDVYLSKYDSSGALIWQRLVGATTESNPGAITVDANDNVYIAGYTPDNLTPEAVIDSVDSFVSKYSSTGEEQWTHQVQAVAPDRATSLAVDASGDVYFGGFVSGVINASATNAGLTDSFLIKLSGSTGSQTASTQFGTAAADRAAGVSIASDGNVLVASTENGHAVIRKLDATDLTNTLWSVDLGDLGTGSIAGLKVDSDGSIFVGGTTANSGLAGSTVNGYSGGTDGFVTRIADNGGSASADWTSYIGTSSADSATGLALGGGKVYLTGSTDGTLSGETKAGPTDAFAAALDTGTGATQWLHQFGTGSTATGIAFAAQGSSVLSTLGLPSGTLNPDQDRSVLSQTSLRAGDNFYISVNGGAKVKITVEKGDTYTTLAQKVKRASFLYVDAYSFPGTRGNTLTIKALRGGSVEIIPGDAGHDALKGLGLDATKLQSDKTLTGQSTSSSDNSTNKDNPADFVFGLGLSSALNLQDHDAAKKALTAIDAAISAIQSAYRKLNPDPLVEALKNQKKPTGTVPAQLQKQLANYQAGLLRLTAGTTA